MGIPLDPETTIAIACAASLALILCILVYALSEGGGAGASSGAWPEYAIGRKGAFPSKRSSPDRLHGSKAPRPRSIASPGNGCRAETCSPTVSHALGGGSALASMP